MTSLTHSQDPEEEQQDPQNRNPNLILDLDEEPDQKQQTRTQTQSPKTLIPKSPDPQNPQTQTTTIPDQSDIDHQQDQEQQDPQAPLDDDQEQTDPEGMHLSPSHMPTPHFQVTIPSTASRRGYKRKKSMAPKRRQALEKKLKTLNQNLKPVCFVPVKTLDFSKHEKLLKRLGLWDFVHLEFDRNIRADLLAQLVANFIPHSRCSYVNLARININRAALARALKLPVKKDKLNMSEAVDCDVEVLSGESVSFIEDFVSNWVLLHEDMWMMPPEVLTSTRLIKDGHPEKVDWAGLIWFMVEKELMQGPQLGHCYYASHLQCLIKSQRESLFAEKPEVEADLKEEKDVAKVDLDIKEEEEEEGDGEDVGKADVDRKEEEEWDGGKVDVDMKEDESGDGGKLEVDVNEDECEEGGDVKMANSDDFQGRELEEHSLELTLGQENVEKEEARDGDVMDFEESKEEEPGQWLLDGKNNGDEQYLRRCNLDEVAGLDCDVERKEDEEEVEEEEEEEEEGEQEEGLNFSPKCNTLDGLSSVNLLPATDAGQIPFSSTVQLHDHSSGEFLTSRADTHTVPGAPSIFGNANKREIDHDNDISLHPLNGNHKRLRTDGSWDNKPFDFDSCMENVQHWMGKARMMYVAKEQACAELNMNQQILLNEVHQRDSMIEHLHKTKYEELQKKQVEIYRLERELYVMGNLLDGYRKALKETHRAFAEYRQRCPQSDEPLYRDVGGNGGVVLSTMEIEKQRLKQEEEEMMKRLMIEKRISDFEAVWISKLEAHLGEVDVLGNKIVDCEKDVTVLKELFAKRKVSDLSACAPKE